MKTWEGNGNGGPSSKWVTVGVLGLGLAVSAWLLDLGLVSGGIGTAPVTTTTTTTTTTATTITSPPAIVAGPAPSSSEISPVPPVPASSSSIPLAPPAPASSPGCPASGVITEHHTTYDAFGRVKTDQWQNVFCGLSETGWCWAPPVLTWPGEPTQTGVDATREVCA